MGKISQKDAQEMVLLLKQIKASWNNGEMGMRHEKELDRLVLKITGKVAGRE